MPWAIRVAAWVGGSVGRWQRRRASKRDDAYVHRWKAAWCAGRDARWAGAQQDANPYRRLAQRQAWMAGWLWASTQPDRRNALRPDRRTQPRGRAARRSRDAAPDETRSVDDAVA
jgi:hypothetical protein